MLTHAQQEAWKRLKERSLRLGTRSGHLIALLSNVVGGLAAVGVFFWLGEEWWLVLRVIVAVVVFVVVGKLWTRVATHVANALLESAIKRATSDHDVYGDPKDC